MSNRIQRAIDRMEEAAQIVIANSEALETETTIWMRRTRRTELLSAARAYARSVDALRRLGL